MDKDNLRYLHHKVPGANTARDYSDEPHLVQYFIQRGVHLRYLRDVLLDIARRDV